MERVKQLVINDTIRVECFRDIIHLEKKKEGEFCSRPTLFDPKKAERKREKFSLMRTGDAVYVLYEDYYIRFSDCQETLVGLSVRQMSGDEVAKIDRFVNSGELPALNATPEVFLIADCPRIIVPKEGYSSERSSDFVVQKEVEDVYILLCRKDLKKLRKLYVELTGRNEMVRLSTLGVWNSRYYRYDEESAKKMMKTYEEYRLPLDVLVIDTDWRKAAERGIGYEVNEELFPDIRRFFEYAHRCRVEIAFNDHPEPYPSSENLFDDKEIAYREEHLTRLLDLGLDYWWYDRNWSVMLKSPLEEIKAETLGMYAFYEITKRDFQKKSTPAYRPIIMGNVNNIVNGKYEKIHDSVSHRYSIQWTGDISSDLFSLKQEVRNLIRAGNQCIPYLSSDLGGHIGNPDKNDYVRWIQFGAFSPIFRPHCSNNLERYREPWNYDEETVRIFSDYVYARYHLLPLIYKEAYVNYLSGEPIFKSKGFNYPEDPIALQDEESYMLSSDILIAPIFEDEPMPLEEKDYLDPVEATYYSGKNFDGEILDRERLEKIDFYLHQTPYSRSVPAFDFCARYRTRLKFDRDVQFYINSDDGIRVYIDGEKIYDAFTPHSSLLQYICDLGKNRVYNVEIEYFQGKGDACLALAKRDASKKKNESVYLPEDRWIDVFRGEVLSGGGYVRIPSDFKQLPLYVRQGALIPLADHALRAVQESWEKLTFDYYPSLKNFASSFLYEDDGKTLAYQNGEYRITPFRTYLEKGNALCIVFDPSYGKYKGERKFDKRKIRIKYHLLAPEFAVKSVRIDKKETSFRFVEKREGVFPFSPDDSACDFDCLIVEFSASMKKKTVVEFLLVDDDRKEKIDRSGETAYNKSVCHRETRD